MDIDAAVNYIRKQGVTDPEIGVILGTGLGAAFLSEVDIQLEINYSDIPDFPEPTVEFHAGMLIYGILAGKNILIMRGRFHYYEGYSLEQVTFPVRVMKLLGVKKLLVSNAAGNMNLNWKKGDLMLIDDHINLLPGNPLRGKNNEAFGPRFPDMSCPYDPEMNDALVLIAASENITLRKGVYVAVCGPNLETRAEYRFLRTIGADAVGMSTVPEVIVANHMSLPVVAISVLTDDCDPDNLAPANIQEIIAIAAESEKHLTKIFVRLIHSI